jgi:hypothetical protein
MRCTPLSCTLSLCTSSLCTSSLYTAPPPSPVAGPALASALPCLSSIRARPCRVRAVVARLHRRSRGSKPRTSPSFDPRCLHRLAQKSFTATPCAARVPQSLAPHQSPQLLLRALAPHSYSSSSLLLNPWALALPLQRPYTCRSSFCTCSTSALASRLELRPAWSHPLPNSASPEPQPAPASPAAWSRQRRSCAPPGSRASAQRRSLPCASTPVCAAPAAARASRSLRLRLRSLSRATRRATHARSCLALAPLRAACSRSPPEAGAPQSAAIGARGREAGGRAPWKRCCQNK